MSDSRRRRCWLAFCLTAVAACDRAIDVPGLGEDANGLTGVRRDAGWPLPPVRNDAGPSGALDAGSSPDAGTSRDAGPSHDAGAPPDAGTSLDAGASRDAGAADAGALADAGTWLDAGFVPDAGLPAGDAGLAVDTFACGARALGTTPITLLRAFDVHLADFGDAYSLQDNRQGVLGNNEPSFLDALLDAYVATGNDRYLRVFVVHGDRVLAHRDDHAGFTDYRGRSAATWSNTHYTTGGQAVSYLIEDGALINSLAHFAWLVRQRSCLTDVLDVSGRTLGSVANTYATAAGETVAFHLQEWHTGSTGGVAFGYFTTPSDVTFGAPEEPGRPVPLNYQAAMGSALAYLWAATGNTSALAYAQRLANFVLLEMANHYHPSADAYTWPAWPQTTYWPGYGWSSYPSPEDLSHSTVTAEFARAMFDTGAGQFYATELQRIAHTYSRLVYRTSDLPIFIDGTGPAAGAHQWAYARAAMLTPHDPSLWSLTYDVAITRLRTHVRGNLQSAGAFTGLARLIRYYP